MSRGAAETAVLEAVEVRCPRRALEISFVEVTPAAVRFVHGNVTRTRQELEQRRRQLSTPDKEDGKKSFFGNFLRRSKKPNQEERRTLFSEETPTTDASDRRDVDYDSGISPVRLSMVFVIRSALRLCPYLVVISSSLSGIVELSFLDAEHFPTEVFSGLELRYWKKITTSIIQLDGECAEGFTSARGDVSGWHLAAIAVDGSIEVWKISEQTHHILLRRYEKSKQR